jgi:hypothetical protein
MTTANTSVTEHAIDTTPQPVSRFVVRQKLTLLVNRYTIHPVDDTGSEGPVIAAAEQKRLAFKERATFYADEERSGPLFEFKARSSLDLGTTYDVTDADGRLIGWFKKEFRKSLTRSTWRMGIPALDLEAVRTGRCRTPTTWSCRSRRAARESTGGWAPRWRWRSTRCSPADVRTRPAPGPVTDYDRDRR